MMIPGVLTSALMWTMLYYAEMRRRWYRRHESTLTYKITMQWRERYIIAAESWRLRTQEKIDLVKHLAAGGVTMWRAIEATWLGCRTLEQVRAEIAAIVPLDFEKVWAGMPWMKTQVNA